MNPSKTMRTVLPCRIVPLTSSRDTRLVATTPHRGDVVFVIDSNDAWIFTEEANIISPVTSTTKASYEILRNDSLRAICKELYILEKESVIFLFDNWKRGVEELNKLSN